MALIERQIVAAVGATAVALSPKARRVARQGAVYGLAGALKLGDVVGATARGAGRGAWESARGQPPAEPARTRVRKGAAAPRKRAGTSSATGASAA
jgi:hypothetical protein